MRKGNIDLLKFIFVCVLVVYHFNSYAEMGLFQCGYNVVSFFFIVSGVSLLSVRCNNTVCYWLGEVSLSIYLGHNFWKLYFLRELACDVKNDYVKVFGMYIVAVIVTALLIMYLSRSVRKVIR